VVVLWMIEGDDRARQTLRFAVPSATTFPTHPKPEETFAM